MHRHFLNVLYLLLLLLSGCGGIPIERGDYGPSSPVDVSGVKEPIPKKEPKSKYGNPKSYVVFGKRYSVMESSKGYSQTGIASWYGKKFHGRRTSSGEVYDMYKMTAAHTALPLPCYVRVKNLENGKEIIVRVNDRGPFYEGRIIDLSYTAASKLDILKKGTAKVRVTAIEPSGREKHAHNPVAQQQSQSKGYVATTEGLYVQIGAFSVRQNAMLMQKKLSALSSHLVTIKPVKQKGLVLYKVMVGPIFHIDLADQIIASLKELGIHESHLVAD